MGSVGETSHLLKTSSSLEGQDEGSSTCKAQEGFQYQSTVVNRHQTRKPDQHLQQHHQHAEPCITFHEQNVSSENSTEHHFANDTTSQSSSAEDYSKHATDETTPHSKNGFPSNGPPHEDDKVVDDVIPGQKRRMAMITVMSLFISCAGMFHSPLLTQYAYQVYTEIVYGNASAGVHITKHPCVPDTAGNASQRDPRQDEVQDKSADLLMRLDMVVGAIGIVVNLLLGSYADVLGRRFVLLVPAVGHFLRNATAPIIIHWNLGLPALYVGYVIDGLCGGTPGLVLGLYLYTADITKADHQRTIGMSIIRTALGLSSAATNVGAGYFIQYTGFFYASLIASLLLLCNAVMACCLPETVPRDRKRCLSPLEAVKRVFGIYTTKGQRYQRTLLLLGLLSFLPAVLPDCTDSKLYNLYLMNKPFCWSSSQIGIFLSARDGINRLASIFLITLLQKCLSPPFLAIIGAASNMAGDVLMGFARTDLMAYMATVVNMAKSMLTPAVRGMMSRLIPPDRQGAMFASLAVVESLSYGLGLFLYFTIYKDTMNIFQGLVFFVSGGLFLCVIFIYIIYHCLLRRVAPVRLSIDIQTDKKEDSQQ